MRPLKNYPNWDFWLENEPSGNPAPTDAGVFSCVASLAGVRVATALLHLQRKLPERNVLWAGPARRATPRRRGGASAATAARAAERRSPVFGTPAEN
jgi:hypothetical protein